MCGIAGIVSLSGAPIERLEHKLGVMGKLIAHRGPDDHGIWCSSKGNAGLAHRRLSILDLSPSGAQPMKGPNETAIVHNGEVYNYLELKDELKDKWPFRGHSDTESVLAAYAIYGDDFVTHLRGMFATAVFDEKNQKLVAVRDRFGIKPFYYAVIKDVFYFASEAKAIVPFLEQIETDPDALAQYLTFQYGIDELTLFKGIKQLMPGHLLTLKDGSVQIRRYWDVDYKIDWDHSPQYFYRHLRELLDDSIDVHLRSDVPIGGYMSGGIDSSLISILAAKLSPKNRHCFHGKFTDHPGYDESDYARIAAKAASAELHQMDITSDDFRDNIENIIYHLDFPIAGPGSFPQYMVSQLAASKVKVVLGGQGGDEIFGGYARYLVAYLEQCIKAALDGTSKDGTYVVTLESILPNMGMLREYKPMMRQLWSEGLFGDLDQRYFRLIDRSADMTDEVDWSELDKEGVYQRFDAIFNNEMNVRDGAYFDKMTHFDFKCLLPALLHVEDRMSMAHGLESRVPLLDHRLVEFAATVPANVKFEAGNMKHMLKVAFNDTLPSELLERRDKMGFPVPLKEWFADDLKEFVQDIFSSKQAQSRAFMRSDKVLESFGNEARFSRKTWGLLSLEIWHQLFHDKAAEWKAKAQ
ncbi:MAG: asparagine synthase (glutamine-hydrolyzing) [Hyphomicrobiaceae bacterium]|nr:asparagine synthase (glutamine-hydrolyzing) [Hyphomicrobiaceae bacterium]